MGKEGEEGKRCGETRRQRRGRNSRRQPGRTTYFSRSKTSARRSVEGCCTEIQSGKRGRRSREQHYELWSLRECCRGDRGDGSRQRDQRRKAHQSSARRAEGRAGRE